MEENRNQQKQKQNKETSLELIIKLDLIKKASDNFDSWIGAGIIIPARVMCDFHVDYSTIVKLRVGDSTISHDTLDKMMYVMVYYLDCCRRKVEAEVDGVTKKAKLDAIPILEKDLEKVYGCKAIKALELAKKGIDLRKWRETSFSCA